MGIKYNIFKDEINHKDFFLGPHVHFFMESPKLVIGLFSLSCAYTTWLLFQFSSQFFLSMFLFHLLFLAFLLQTVHSFFCFSIVSLLFSHSTQFKFLLIHCISILYCLCSFHAFNQWLN